MRRTATSKEPERPSLTRVAPQPEREDHPAWEEIEAGRYMPRRIRGSFPGRELG
jgi:hypothetical protein